jgi:hypothetical protein
MTRALAACAADALRRLKFPTSKGITTVAGPVLFLQ